MNSLIMSNRKSTGYKYAKVWWWFHGPVPLRQFCSEPGYFGVSVLKYWKAAWTRILLISSLRFANTFTSPAVSILDLAKGRQWPPQDKPFFDSGSWVSKFPEESHGSGWTNDDGDEESGRTNAYGKPYTVSLYFSRAVFFFCLCSDCD